MLSLDLKPGDRVDIDGGRVIVRLEQKSGQLARLQFEADAAIQIRMLPGQGGAARAALKGIGNPE